MALSHSVSEAECCVGAVIQAMFSLCIMINVASAKYMLRVPLRILTAGKVLWPIESRG